MIARRMASMFPPVERSITVSAPRSMAILSFASSLSMFEVTAELPMLALTLQRALIPIPIGSSPSPRWTVFAGMIIRPRATSERIVSGSSPSRRATNSIASEMIPCRASSSCVMLANPLRTGCVSPAVLLARRRDEEIPEAPVEITLSLVYHLCERSVRRPRRPGRLSTAGLGTVVLFLRWQSLRQGRPRPARPAGEGVRRLTIGHPRFLLQAPVTFRRRLLIPLSGPMIVSRTRSLSHDPARPLPGMWRRALCGDLPPLPDPPGDRWPRTRPLAPVVTGRPDGPHRERQDRDRRAGLDRGHHRLRPPGPAPRHGAGRGAGARRSAPRRRHRRPRDPLPHRRRDRPRRHGGRPQ